MGDEGQHDLAILGTSGLKQYGGYVLEEFHRRLQGRQAVRVYREMADNSSTIGAIRYLIKALVRQAEWRIEPADESPKANEQAEFVEGALADMSHTFEDLLSETLSMLDYGWAYVEIVYKLRKGNTDDPTTRSQFDDGKFGWRKLAVRSQDTLDRWEFDPADGGIRGMWQDDIYAQQGGGSVFIPIEKSLLFRTETTKNNPEGRSLYRNAVVDYHYLKRIQEIEAVGIERDMTGLLTMEVPLELLSSDAAPREHAIRQKLEKMLAQLKRDEREFAMVPPELDRTGKPTGYKLKLLATGGRRQIDTNGTKVYYKNSILQSVLAQFIQLGMAQTAGSFALASSQTNLFAVALGTIMDSVASVFNRFAIPRLMKLNNVPVELHPWLTHGDIESPPLDEVGKYVTALAAAGQLPVDDKPLQRKLLEIGNLPQPTEHGVEKARTRPGKQARTHAEQRQLELPMQGGM